MNTISLIICALFFGWIGGWACEIFIRGFARLRKPVIIDWAWKDIKKFPIPEYKDPSSFKEILITDGQEVDTMYLSSPKYNSKAEPVFAWDNKVITHWSEFPSPPIKER